MPANNETSVIDEIGDSAILRAHRPAHRKNSHGLSPTLAAMKKPDQPWGLLLVGIVLLVAAVVLVFLVFHQ
jgi:hypothetical protein